MPKLLSVTVFSFFTILVIYELYSNLNNNEKIYRKHYRQQCNSDYEMLSFDNFDNELGNPSGCYIVPNYVHFIRFDQPNISFVDAVCILAVLKNQKPDRLYIHTNSPYLSGPYWEKILNKTNIIKVLKFNYVELPGQVFGQTLNIGWQKFHGADIIRLKVLMKFGGIFLDNDSYIVRSLNDLRRYEMTLGWMHNGSLANQAIIANKNARFLQLWLNTYKNGYNKTQWYYNAGVKPTEMVLNKNPGIIHREPYLLVRHRGMVENIYLKKWSGWKDHYVIHLLSRHQYMLNKKVLSNDAKYPVNFNEKNIKYFPVTFRDMVNDVFKF